MNFKTGLKTGIAALAIATAPLNASAQKAAKAVVADTVKVENTVAKKGKEIVTAAKNAGRKATPAEQEGVFRVGVDYSTRDILGVRTSEPRVRAQFDGRSGAMYFRPEVAVGPQSYNAVVPLGAQFNVARGTSVEVGADLAGIRGFHNGTRVFSEEAVQSVMNGERCGTNAASGEFFQNLNVGARYKNDVVNASVRGEVGRTAYIDSWGIKETPASNLEAIQASGHPIKPDQASGYVGARANVEVTPFRNNRNVAFNAEGAVSTNKGPEASVGVAYKF